MFVSNLVANNQIGSSAFSKSSLYIWKFSVHVLLKPILKDFEHYLASKWNENNCTTFWTVLGIVLLWGQKEKWPFLVLWPLLSFPFLLTYDLLRFEIAQLEFHHLHIFVVKPPKVHLTLHSRISGSRWVTTPSWLSKSLRSFLYSSSMCSCHLFLISSASVRSLSFCPLSCPILRIMFPWYL